METMSKKISRVCSIVDLGVTVFLCVIAVQLVQNDTFQGVVVGEQQSDAVKL